MITEKGIIMYDTKTGREIPVLRKDIDAAYAQLGPRVFHAVAALGGEYSRQNEIATKMIGNYARPTAEQTDNPEREAEYSYSKEGQAQILTISKQMDEAMKRKDWNAVRALKDEKRRLEGKL